MEISRPTLKASLTAKKARVGRKTEITTKAGI
jgi:hypothetical protein